MDLDGFMSQFRFNADHTGRVGVELEAFITDQDGVIVPRSPEFLAALNGHALSGQIGYELSACQVETRTAPLPLRDLVKALDECKAVMAKTAAVAGLGVKYIELGPHDIPLDVYPEPRYQAIKAKLDVETLRAGCRVAGVHVHVGMPDHGTALRVYRHLRPYVEHLAKLGDHSNGERMRLYRGMTPESDPPDIESWHQLHAYACSKGWETDPRSWWSLIRISKHGTMEFRMFGSTDDTGQIFNWANLCHKLCIGAM